MELEGGGASSEYGSILINVTIAFAGRSTFSDRSKHALAYVIRRQIIRPHHEDHPRSRYNQHRPHASLSIPTAIKAKTIDDAFTPYIRFLLPPRKREPDYWRCADASARFYGVRGQTSRQTDRRTDRRTQNFIRLPTRTGPTEQRNL